MSAITENAVSRHRLTVEAFHRMGEAGIFLEDDRVELIDGEIIDMAPIGSKHAAIVAELSRLFVVAVETQARVWIQNPIRRATAVRRRYDGDRLGDIQTRRFSADIVKRRAVAFERFDRWQAQAPIAVIPRPR